MNAVRSSPHVILRWKDAQLSRKFVKSALNPLTSTKLPFEEIILIYIGAKYYSHNRVLYGQYKVHFDGKRNEATRHAMPDIFICLRFSFQCSTPVVLCLIRGQVYSAGIFVSLALCLKHLSRLLHRITKNITNNSSIR